MAAVNLALGNPNTDAVNLLQTALTGLCYFDGTVDGVFGSGTEAALRAFQKQAGIKVDGRYGPATATSLAALDPSIVQASGASTPHENRQPFLAINYCICTVGIYPARP